MANSESNTDLNPKLQDLSVTFHDIIHLSDEMMEIMEKQMDAVISAEHTEIEKCTEEYVNLKGQLKKKEIAFTKELKEQLKPIIKEETPLKLDALKSLFPESSETIDGWKKTLYEKTKKLQKTDEKLVELLKFAMDRNREFMHTLYSFSDRKNIQYSSSGNTKDLSPGIAINHEV